MKVLNSPNFTYQKQNCIKNNASSINHQKSFEESALELQAVQNLSFSGLFFPRNAKYIRQDIEMKPNKYYEICDDSVFLLSNNVIFDLSSDDVRYDVEGLHPNEYMEFGRSESKFSGINDTVSNRHLCIERGRNGKLYAKDLGSKNGTKILTNISTSMMIADTTRVMPNEPAKVLPMDGVLKLADDELVSLNLLKDRLFQLPEGKSFVIGRGFQCDLTINNKNVLNKHASLKRMGDKVVVKNLGSTSSVTYIPSWRLGASQNDVSGIQEIIHLKPEVETKIPNDCQLYLADNLVIDVRNPNILNMLDKKGAIKIGRDSENDIIVNQFYSYVSNRHLQLSKKGNEIFATDLGSRNGTKVIPKQKIKPFYGDLSKIELSQANVGDCYLLSTLYAMSRSYGGRKILGKMVQVDDRGNYIVKFHNKSPIVVRQDELDGQKMDDKEKRSVSGELGIKAIERAYAKMIKEEDLNERCSDYNPKTMFYSIDEGGFMTTALEKMTGIQSQKILGYSKNIDNILYKLSRDMGNYIITCSTYQNGKYGKFMDKNQTFHAKHAYSIKNINPKDRTIEIVNPHNTTKTKWISWDDFKEVFDYLCYADVYNL